MQKPMSVKIMQIVASAPEGGSVMVFGLGDDQNIYRWSAGEHVWVPYAQR